MLLLIMFNPWYRHSDWHCHFSWHRIIAIIKTRNIGDAGETGWPVGQ